MTSEPLKKRRLSLDEIMQGFSDIAQDPDAGAQRLRALQILKGDEASGVTLPEPRTDEEIIWRGARVMKSMGKRMTQLAYQKAFPHSTKGAVLQYIDATDEMRARASRITSIKMLNREYPEGKVNGIPIGYPARSSNAEKMLWVKKQALRMEVERGRREVQGAHDAMKAGGQETSGADAGGMEAPVDVPVPDLR